VVFKNLVLIAVKNFVGFPADWARAHVGQVFCFGRFWVYVTRHAGTTLRFLLPVTLLAQCLCGNASLCRSDVLSGILNGKTRQNFV
jgi:hypothetical protein